MPLSWPFTSYASAVEGTINAANSIYEVVNGDNVTDVVVDQGDPIPSLRKTLKFIEDLGTNQFRAKFTSQNFLATAFETILVDTSTVSLQVTLPDNANEGEWVVILDYLGNSAVNNIIVNTTDATLIEGNPTFVIGTNKAEVVFYKTSTQWIASLSVSTLTLADVRDTFIEPFDTLTDVVNDLGLQIGRRVQTLGYSTKGDGRREVYEIVPAGTGTPDGEFFIDLAGITGQAQLIINKVRYSQAIQFFDQTITEDTTIKSTQNALSVDPTVGGGVTVTVEPGATWAIAGN